MSSNAGGAPCNKTRFPTLAAAEQALFEAKLARFLRPGRTKRHEQRAYCCRACAAWHLTKQPAPSQEVTP